MNRVSDRYGSDKVGAGKSVSYTFTRPSLLSILTASLAAAAGSGGARAEHRGAGREDRLLNACRRKRRRRSGHSAAEGGRGLVPLHATTPPIQVYRGPQGPIVTPETPVATPSATPLRDTEHEE